MGKWIDADALIAKMTTVMDMQDTYLPIHFKEWLIDTAPSIDIVRCKECKFGEFYAVDTGEDYMTGLWCELNQRDCMIDDFCSYGERREP